MKNLELDFKPVTEAEEKECIVAVDELLEWVFSSTKRALAVLVLILIFCVATVSLTVGASIGIRNASDKLDTLEISVEK